MQISTKCHYNVQIIKCTGFPFGKASRINMLLGCKDILYHLTCRKHMYLNKLNSRRTYSAHSSHDAAPNCSLKDHLGRASPVSFQKAALSHVGSLFILAYPTSPQSFLPGEAGNHENNQRLLNDLSPTFLTKLNKQQQGKQN